MGRVIAELWQKAEAASQHHHSQIQGFFYQGAYAVENTGQLVVRDLTQPKRKQVLWSRYATPGEYDALHAEMLQVIELRRIEIVAEFYASLTAEAQPIDTGRRGTQKFPCQCGAAFDTILDTRTRSDGSIRRRRRCSGCGEKITTIEAPVQLEQQEARVA